MKRTLIAASIVLLAAATASAGIANTKHNLASGSTQTTRATVASGNTELCNFCHVPHGAMTGFNVVDETDTVAVTPLWNHTLGTATYTLYTSTTMDAAPAAINSGTTITNMCLSCHDGTVALGAMQNYMNTAPGPVAMQGNVTAGNALSAASTALLSTNLTNDHPINMTYNTADTGLVAAPPAGYLFSNTVQCASCHDVHDNTFAPFLRATNVGSALCLACHAK